MRRSLVWAALGTVAMVALAASALGSGAGLNARALQVASGSQTFTVNVDGVNKKVNESFDAYFPSVVSVHAGDTVVFHYVGIGEPHTVALGTLANAAVSAFGKLSPAQLNNPPKSAIALDAKVPQFTSGPGSGVVPAAGNPCFLAAGTPSSKAPCPAGAQPAFDGKQSFYDSGWFKANEKFTVHLSSSTPAGSYHFMCLVHREFMQGTIKVVPSGTMVASPAAQYASGQKQLAADEAGLTGPAKLLAQGKPPIPGVSLPGSNPILVGSGAPGSNDPGQIDQFGPTVVHIPVGGSVTWWLAGLHTITFNSTKADNDIQSVAKNGDVQINGKAAAPIGGPGEPPKPPTGGSRAHINFKIVASQSWNGTGFHNSGIFGNSQPPNIEGYKLTFTHAGTYKFICTVHDNMKGTVVVGNS
jgi:plastocyanin